MHPVGITNSFKFSPLQAKKIARKNKQVPSLVKLFLKDKIHAKTAKPANNNQTIQITSLVLSAHYKHTFPTYASIFKLIFWIGEKYIL
jgi:hypothetical protein